jgi:hypothetical protein
MQDLAEQDSDAARLVLKLMESGAAAGKLDAPAMCAWKHQVHWAGCRENNSCSKNIVGIHISTYKVFI